MKKLMIIAMLFMLGCVTEEPDIVYPYQGEAWEISIQKMKYDSEGVNNKKTFEAFMISIQDDVKLHADNADFYLEYNKMVYNLRKRFEQ